MRIVSLVPSLTELLFALGLDEAIVGRTGFCVHPAERVRAVPKIGGTKTVNEQKIRRLAPSHLVVNVDENEKPTVDRLARFVPQIVVTHPLDVGGNLDLYRQFGGVFGREREAAELARAFEAALAATKRTGRARLRVLYLIWKDPWMAAGRGTFIADMLAQVGLDCVTPPGSARYPRLDVTDFAALAPDAVILSSEPYRFDEAHAAELAGDPALGGAPCVTVDGEMCSWYGPRATAGLRYLLDFRQALDARIAASRLTRPRIDPQL